MPPTRTRRTKTQSTTLTELGVLVDALVKENRSLKRQLKKLEAVGVTAPKRGRTADPVATGLTRLNRKLRTALDGAAPARARGANRTKAVRAPRKPVSPEVAARRLEALAKARAARAAKKAAAEAS